MSGKGSTRRPTDEKKVRKNWPFPDHYNIGKINENIKKENRKEIIQKTLEEK